MQGYQCGMLWGATLAAGAQAYRLYGSDPRAVTKAMIAARGLVESFRAQNNHINCLEITETDPRNKWQVFWNFFVKGGTFRCMARAADYAPEAFSEIDTALSGKHNEEPCHPASCAAILAKKMGTSDRHAVMASGFAGGIGLSGGACGALGAAIWIIGMNGRKEGLANKVIDSRISDTIDSFLKSAGYEFECSEIVGHRFDDIGDHAGFLQQGGCSEIIEALAAAAGVVRDHRLTPASKEAVYPGREAAAV
jgi:hypothetical protein